jgi:Zn finger protein HypA/HybF involved in hydrogenase expression
MKKSLSTYVCPDCEKYKDTKPNIYVSCEECRVKMVEIKRGVICKAQT